MLYFEPSGWWVYPILLIALVVSFLAYWRNPFMSELKRTQKNTLLVLRLSGVFILCLLLLRPYYLSTEIIERPAQLLLATDNSQSMLSHDLSPTQWNEKLRPFLKELETEVEINRWQFDSEVSPLLDSLEYNGLATNINALLQRTESSFGGDPRFRGLLLLSDGQMNQGVDPVLTAANLSYPIHTLSIGNSPEGFDAAITSLRFNREVEVGNRIEISGSLRAKAGRNQRLTLELVDEKGKSIESRRFQVSTNDQTFGFSFFPEVGQSIGNENWKLSLKSEEEDENQNNNERNVRFAVIERSSLVSLIYDSQHPDLAALARSLKDYDTYQLEYIDIRKDEKPSLDSKLWIVVHPGALAIERLGALQQNSKASIWWLAGYTESAEGFGRFPVPIRFDPSKGKDDEAGPAFSNLFSAFKLSEEQQQILGDGAPLSAPYGKWSFGAGAEVQLYQKIGSLSSERPLMFTVPDRKDRQWAVLTARGLWRWRMQEYRKTENTKVFDEWVSSWVRFLQNDQESGRIQFNALDEVALGGIWELDARVKDASGSWSKESKLSMSIRYTNGQTQELTALQNGESYGFRFRPDEAGRYTFSLQASLGNEDFKQNGSFYVTEISLEALQNGADTTLLYQLAKETNGSHHLLMDVESWSELIDHMDLRPVQEVLEERRELIHWKILFGLMLFLFSLEWGMRRYLGLY